MTPGDTLILWVYWHGVHPSGNVYRAFVHLGENPVWAQQDDDPACRLPTSLWRAGQGAKGQFRLVVPYEMPIGRYPLTLGSVRSHYYGALVGRGRTWARDRRCCITGYSGDREVAPVSMLEDSNG